MYEKWERENKDGRVERLQKWSKSSSELDTKQFVKNQTENMFRVHLWFYKTASCVPSSCVWTIHYPQLITNTLRCRDKDALFGLFIDDTISKDNAAFHQETQHVYLLH